MLIDPIKNFKNNVETFDFFLRSLSTIRNTGVLDFLRERGRVRNVSELSTNYVAAQATMASWSLGYNQALDDLIYFKELFMADVTKNQPPPTFGSLKRAVETGDLTEEEAEALRNGTDIPILK